MNLVSEASLQIQKPIATVYQAIVDPAIMTKFFISESSARLDSTEPVIWKFPEFPDRFPISNIKLKENQLVSFVWDPDTTVTIFLESQADKSTVVKVIENGKPLNDTNMKWLVSNAGGWANFLACMKAYLEYGIELRKGAYDFMASN